MFESIIIRRPLNEEHGYDAGLIAEALFYCQNVHLLVDHQALDGLLRSIGPESLLRLIEDGFVTATHVRDSVGTRTDTSKGVPIYSFVEWHFTGTQETKPRLPREERIRFIFERALGTGWRTRRFAKQFAKKVPVVPLSEGIEHERGVPGLAHDDLGDKTFVRRAIEIALRDRLPGYEPPPEWDVDIVKCKDDFVISCNLDFARIGAHVRQRSGKPEDDITPAHLVGPILNARADMTLAAKHMSELVTDPATARVIQLRFGDMLRKRERSQRDIEAFQEVTLQNARAIRDAVNSGAISFSEFLDFVSKSRRFRHWLKEANPDKKLLDEYNASITKGTWVESLPSRAARFAVFTGAGLLLGSFYGAAAGVAVAAADQFLFDRLYRGWKPHQFIHGRLKPLVGQEKG